MAETAYYAVNDRPVKIVPTPDGGADCLVFDFATGGFTPDRRYLSQVLPGSGKDVDKLSEQEFAALVEARRTEAFQRRRETPIAWQRTGDGYAAEVKGRSYVVREAGGALTLFVDGREVETLAGWPEAWTR